MNPLEILEVDFPPLPNRDHLFTPENEAAAFALHVGGREWRDAWATYCTLEHGQRMGLREEAYALRLSFRRPPHEGLSILRIGRTSGTTKRDPRKNRTMVAKAKKTAKKASKRTTKSPKAAAGKTAKKPAKKAARKTAKK